MANPTGPTAHLEGGFWWHQKIRDAGNAAVGAFARMLAYAAVHATDGLIDADTAATIARRSEIAKLVEVGLLARVDGGFQVHDFDHYNTTKADAELDRRAAAARSARWRAGRQKDPNKPPRDASRDAFVTRDVTRDERHTNGIRHARAKDLDLELPDDLRSSVSARAREPETARAGASATLTPASVGALARLTSEHPLLATKMAAETVRRFAAAGTSIDDLRDAVDNCAAAGFPVNPNTIQRELSGPPRSTQPSTASVKAQGWSDAADVVRGMRVNGNGAAS